MFGYINVNRKELSKENTAVYQSYYCGLCQQLREDYGGRGQMLLNYDMTFLILLLTGLYEPGEEEKKFTCAMHPAGKHTSRRNDIVAYAAAMNVLLSYCNLLDDVRDSGDPAKKALLKVLEKDYNQVAALYPRQAKALEESMEAIAAAEREGVTNIDVLAGCSGEMLMEIFAWQQEDIWAEELRNLAYYMGKFIYLMDAYDDLEEDRRKKQFNPLLVMGCEDDSELETVVRSMLNSLMAECAKSFERLPIVTHAEILRNILYSGVWTRYEIRGAKYRKDRKKQERKARKGKEAEEKQLSRKKDRRQARENKNREKAEHNPVKLFRRDNEKKEDRTTGPDTDKK